MGNLLGSSSNTTERETVVPPGLTFHVRYKQSEEEPVDELAKVAQWVKNESNPSMSTVEARRYTWEQEHICMPYNADGQRGIAATTYLESVWHFARKWCNQTHHVTRTYVTIPTVTAEVPTTFSAEFSDLTPGTWEDSNRFSACPTSLWSGITEGCIKFEFRHKRDVICLYVKMRDEYFCFELKNGMFYQYLSFTAENQQTELFLHLKDRPFIYKLEKKDITHDIKELNMDDKKFVWNRTADIGDENRKCLGKADILKICIGGKQDAIKMLQSLCSRGWTCRFLQVQERDLKQEFIMGDTLTSILVSRSGEGYSNFETRYLLDMLMSRGFKMIVKMTPGSWLLENLLGTAITFDQKKIIAHKLLETCDSEQEWFCVDVESSLSPIEKRGAPRARPGRCLVRRARITPTQVILGSEEQTDSCRILRENQVDCFLRVTFRDENHTKLTQPSDEFIQSVVGERLMDGLVVAGVKYFFLGGSSSYLKDHGCCLYRQDDKGHLARDLRKSVGDLSKITSVAKYLARFGLTFSQTSDGVRVKGKVVEDDIIKKGSHQSYCFSDGIGKISMDLAEEVTSKRRGRLPPSAYQFRMGGAKGVLALDPSLSGKKVVLRKSMIKFESEHDHLDIQSVSKPKRLFMNHQIVTLLSQLGVQDETFLRLQEQHIDRLLWSLFDESEAREQLGSILPGVVRVEALKKIGCQVTTVPFFRQLLLAHVKQDLFSVLKKARFAIPEASGRNLMGVLDETASLEYGQVFVQYSNRVYNNGPGDYHILTGDVVVSKMPGLHPGDVRKLRAVDIKKLHHLKDVIVFPQKGKRPHSNEMSGSDLDGDEYWVSWHPDLLISKNKDPMDFPEYPEQHQEGDIQEEHMISYLMSIIQNDVTQIIARAHLTQADVRGRGIFSDECIRLAALHSEAVDAQKTGRKVVIPDNLLPTQWPDFLQKQDHKPTYESRMILGKLFREYQPLDRGINVITTTKPELSTTHRSDAQCVPGTKISLATDHQLNRESPLSIDVQKARQQYEYALKALLRKYGLSNEIQLFTKSLHQSSISAIRDGDKFVLGKRLLDSIKETVKTTRQAVRDRQKNSLDQVAKTCFASTGTMSSFPWVVVDWLDVPTVADCAGNKIQIKVGEDLLSVIPRQSEERVKEIFSGLTENMLNMFSFDKWLSVVFLIYALVLQCNVNEVSRIAEFVVEEAASLQMVERNSGDTHHKSFLEKLQFWKTRKTTLVTEIRTYLQNELQSEPADIAEKVGQLGIHILISSLHESAPNHILYGWIKRVQAVVELMQNGKLLHALVKDVPSLQDTTDGELILTLCLGAYQELSARGNDLTECLRRKGFKIENAKLEETKGTKQLIVKGNQRDFASVDNYVQSLNRRHAGEPKPSRETGRTNKERQPPRQKGSSIECYNCGNIGHIAKDCPIPNLNSSKACYNCKDTGHIAKGCPYAPNRKCFNCDGIGHIARDCPRS